MHAHALRVGRTYAYPTTPGPWYRDAVPARVMSHGPRDRVLVLLPDGVPAGVACQGLPRASLVWIDASALASSWEEWPARAASARDDLSIVVASAVAAIAGRDAPSLQGPTARRVLKPWWARPIHELLRPPATTPVASVAPHRTRSGARS